MDISPADFLNLLIKCDDACDVLYEFNKNNRLLNLNGKHLLGERYDERNMRVVRAYMSNLQNVERGLTLEELFEAFEKYYADILAAIAIERAMFQARMTQK